MIEKEIEKKITRICILKMYKYPNAGIKINLRHLFTYLFIFFKYKKFSKKELRNSYRRNRDAPEGI